jgi:hypothetical protein
MKLYFVGGVFQPEAPDAAAATALLRTSMGELGAEFARAGHELIVCSPYEGSVDVEIVRGAAGAVDEPVIHIHYPDTAEIRSEVQALASNHPKLRLRQFQHVPMEADMDGAMRYGWLLSQLSAMDEAHVVVAAGGNPSGSANMLLHLAEVRRKPILPLGHLGGAALRTLERLRYELEDRIGDLKAWLQDPSPAATAGEVLTRLLPGGSAAGGERSGPRRFFLSYARERPGDADLVESTLRRRNLPLFRDEHAFEPGKDLPGQVREHIHRADVFVALWSKEYACSPWCYDELDLAIERQRDGTLAIWLLDLDGTRMVPPKARNLIYYPCRSREAIEAKLISLLDPPGPAAG